MTWFDFGPVLLAATMWLLVPGALALWLLGARGLLLYAGAGPASVAFLGVLAICFGAVGIRWTPWTVAAAVAAAGAALLIVRLLLRSRWPLRGVAAGPFGTMQWTAVGAAVAGALAVGSTLLIALGDPDAVSQTFDSAFHLNAVRFIIEAGNASTFAIAGVTGASSIYPAAWHDLTSLVAMSTGGMSIPAAANAVSVAISALVWTSGLLVLARVLAPNLKRALWFAAVLSAALPWFPLLPITFGVLFPYFVALSCLPLAFALVISAVGRGDSLAAPLPLRIVLLAAVSVATALAQPSVLLGLFAGSLPVLAAVFVALFRAASTVWRRAAIAAGAFVVLLVAALAWRQLGAVGYTAPWDAEGSPLRGAFEVLTFTFEAGPPAFGFAIIVAVGVVVSLMRPGRRWIAGMWFIGAVMYFAAVVLPGSDLRNVLLGVFYKDIPRLASFFVIVSIPAALVGAIAASKVLLRLIDRSPRANRRILAITATVVALGVFCGLQAPAMASAIGDARRTYALTDRSPMLSIDERTLIERMPEVTGLDGLVAGNPWTGTSFAYALVAQPVLNPHFNTVQLPARTIVNSSLDRAASDPEVCDAVRALDVRWVLDFGTFFEDAADELHFSSSVGYEGYLDLAEAPGFVEVDREGDAVLYRVDACD